MISVKTKEELNALQNHVDGEFIAVEDTREVYQYKDGQYNLVDANTEIDTGVTLYELNQTAVDSLPTVDDYQITSCELKVEDYVKNKNNKYYMLLCNELKYYTLFVDDSGAKDAEAPTHLEMMNCLRKLGDIKSVEPTEDNGAIEAWVQCFGDNVSHVFYFFGYDLGVINCL